tara:strand:+ start:65 stop:463 length:399 start_codon:yes stop_codon:yes gene_type:complete
MYYKLLVSILIFFAPNMLSGKNYMMNCTSPDFKTTAFYKYDSANEKLLIRPMKNKWKNFCKTNTQSEESISCTFYKFNIIRSSTIKKQDEYLNKLYNISFIENSLIETIKIYKNNILEEKIDNIYKCRKIKI